MIILGISAYYHNSAAALLIDGKLIAAAQEERFTRQKNDASFPSHAIRYVMQEAAISGADVTYVAFYEKPFLKFERLLETYHAFAPRGFAGFIKSVPLWLKDKLYMKRNIRKALSEAGISAPLLFPEHHLSHAAAAFFPSPYKEAAILTVDGIGEWATTVIGRGDGNRITFLKTLHFPHSLGLLYAAFTSYCGFKVNSGEYKLMGLAPYGNREKADPYIRLIKEHLVDIRPDGSFLLNMKYFNFATALRMTNVPKWKKLFDLPPRKPESEIRPEYIELAYAIQYVTEEILLKLAATAKKLTGCTYLTMAGGVALNCVANGKIRESGLFAESWIQPAADDAGGAVGAAYAVWYMYAGNPRIVFPGKDCMSGGYLGPSFSEKEILAVIRRVKESAGYPSVQTVRYEDNELYRTVTRLLIAGEAVGWFQGRMEFGPRALGNRSILADPRNTEIQRTLNLSVKKRESFRPFAPSVLAEDADKYFTLAGTASPYMLQVARIKNNIKLRNVPPEYSEWEYIKKLYTPRSLLQAITHVDFSARIQTVTRENNPRYYELLSAFKRETGYGVLVNTSFNVRGEPIVCTPSDAYTCFIHTGLKYLVIGNWLFTRH